MTESQIQEMVADYLRLRHPDVLFHSDFGSGAKLRMGQAVRQKRLNGGRRAWPDLFIAKPKADWKGGRSYFGLFIELKKDGERLRPGPRGRNRFESIDGRQYKTEHLMEQADVLFRLRKSGYKAEFAVGYDEAIAIIEDYLN